MIEKKRKDRIKNFAIFFDKKFTLPGTEIKFGWDAIIGLIPGIGDSLTALISSWLVYEAHQMKIPFFTKARMMWNIFLDWLIGLIPFFGDIFDFAWRANQKNAEIILKHVENQEKKLNA